MRATITDRCKVWEIKDYEGYAEVKFSTSRKVKEDSSYDQVQVKNGVAKNGYIADYRNFVRFVGHAYNKLKEINIGDVITNLVGDMSTEPYWDSKTGMICYPKNEKITIFEFEKYENNNYNNMDKAPQVVNEAPKNNTTQSYNTVQYNQAVTQPPVTVQPDLKAADECPF